MSGAYLVDGLAALLVGTNLSENDVCGAGVCVLNTGLDVVCCLSTVVLEGRVHVPRKTWSTCNDDLDYEEHRGGCDTDGFTLTPC